MRAIFGTDGMRGVANSELSPELAFAVGRAGAVVFARTSDRHQPVIVGRDTRISGTMLEAAVVAGITSAGRDVICIGIVPTPAVALITERTGAAAGCMISASHNPIGDNGIKFFGADGFKLSDDLEYDIESLVDSTELPRPTGTGVGVARVAQNLGALYYEALYADAADLAGLTIVVDAAYGAAYTFAPYALRKLGAKVHELHCEPDGARINVGCGATDLGPLASRVRDLAARGAKRVLGIAFDGDGDRALFVDETGDALTGDHTLFVLGRAMQKKRELAHNTIVATVMSNVGLQRALEPYGITLVRTRVGDRYVLERMRADGYVLGGEQSGHIIDLGRNTTGDGPMTAVTVCSTVVTSGATLRELAREMRNYPQILLNVRTADKTVVADPAIAALISKTERQLGESGRVLVRASGTEPLIRVMIEGADQSVIEGLARHLADAIERKAVKHGSAR
ncbi:MAG: phosphoglucosamine mutase [Candidatus Meridianibacter frigidus]|nr:MAG: phosphoglucosamine mutase [Candidatus Eremiobacteraeota bacterium]